MMTADEIYRVIAGEIRDGRQDDSTWTRAFAEADGDEAKTKARYIRLRLAQLKDSRAISSALVVSVAAPLTSALQSNGMPAFADLAFARDSLAQQLSESGRRSLYSQLNICASSDDDSIQRAISAVKERAAQGTAISAEESYAIQTLGDPVSREQYDRKLLASISKNQADSAPSFSEPEYESPIKPAIHIAAVVALIAIAAYSGLGVYREQNRKEAEIATTQLRESVVLTQRNDRVIQRESSEAIEQRRAEANDRAQALAAERESARQREMDFQRNQAEERRFQAEQQKRRVEKEQEARAEHDKARRLVIEAERELCMAARSNNNPGAIARYCK